MNAKPKHIKILEGLFKLPENKECADCKSRAPRWTSVNLGIFICLQCSGIHRSLGVHISKVRSATLDTWLPEQVSFMKSMGNGKANAYWEAGLPPHYNRGQIQNFIRAKYVEKRWIPKDCKDKSPSEPQPQLLSSRSSRRYGCIAEWTNSQQKLKDGRDFSVDEKDRAVSRPGTGVVSIDRADNVNQNQHQEKKDNYRPPLDQRANVSIHNINQHQEKKDNSRPPLDQRANVSIHSVNAKPSKEPTQVVRSFSVNDSLRKSVQVSKTKLSAANAMPSIPSPKVDYADELFRTLFMDDSADNNSNSNMNEWVRFDSDQKSSTPEAKIVPETAIGKEITHKANMAVKPAASNFNLDFQTAMVPFLTEHLGEQQKNVTDDKQRLSDKSNMVPASSMHLQQLAKPAQGVSSTDASKFPVSTNGFQHQLYVNGGRVMNTTGSQMPMQNFQRMNSAPYTMSRFQGPAFPSKGISVAPARGPPASLPVSGYDYDFSVLTQGMFTKR